MLTLQADIEKTVFGASNLLEQPLHHVLLEVNDMRSRETTLKSVLSHPVFLSTDSRLQRKMNPVQRVAATASSTVMWVDKYRPKKFSDLMGEEVSRPSLTLCPADDSECTGTSSAG